MNILLWVLQVAVALLSLAGGAYKVFGFDAVANEPFFGALSRGGWSALGALEMGCALLLIVPTGMKRRPVLLPLAAGVLALESAGLGVLYARYSVELTGTNPLPWVVAMGIMAAFIAYGRYALAPKGLSTR